MQPLFRLLRKNRNRTRFLAVFFLFCIVAEVFSHAQQGVQILIAELLPSTTKICIADEDSEISDKGTIAPVTCSDKKEDDHPLDLGDQLSHHQVLAVSFTFKPRKVEQSSEKIVSRFDTQVYRSLPPPYLPPELS